jgi:hypothetical protein
LVLTDVDAENFVVQEPSQYVIDDLYHHEIKGFSASATLWSQSFDAA